MDDKAKLKAMEVAFRKALEDPEALKYQAEVSNWSQKKQEKHAQIMEGTGDLIDLLIHSEPDDEDIYLLGRSVAVLVRNDDSGLVRRAVEQLEDLAISIKNEVVS